jgi:malate dehydrogenase (oxaloacetate-decarboxylating)(NADP+)
MSNEEAAKKFKEEEPLLYHEQPYPGKYKIASTKPMNNQQDLALAYSPGVAAPCLAIQKNPALANKYTVKGNMVAVISNGTAVLGLGDIGALAAKPVMEGKAVLFSKFAGIESIDICVDAKKPDDFINCVRYLAPSFGGINLEDIKAPDCFYVEEKLKELMPIPVFHDDQHGTAIVTLAGFINGLKITGKDVKKCKVVLNGAGAAGIACVKLLHLYGVPKANIVICDTNGVVYKGRAKGMNKYKDEFATDRPERTLLEALKGSDVFIGVSGPNLLTAKDVKGMADKPMIFAMANPTPEIFPDEARKGCPDAIIATGRSDFPNQINNVMCFPFLFRGTLDAGAREINDQMKMAVAKTLAEIA